MTKRMTEESNLDPTAHAGGTTTDGTLTLDAIRSLAQVMKDFELAELELSQPSGERLRLVGRRAEVIAAAPIATKSAPSVVVAAPEPHHAPAAPPATGKAPAVDKSITVITAPLVGTFYRSASPESPAFVEIGQRVKKGQTLCIIEAMKLMNELECEVEGVVVAILGENGRPVEFGEPLFHVKTG
ncbi:MAG TPA: acetyl-CoA carboxylase biotin carboxyl carrier protein [Pseudomonadota bacterium]|nr:acetyl-CoA carboxylase biotin carboxyl carrier protein [Pseudomonadota bacterium]